MSARVGPTGARASEMRAWRVTELGEPRNVLTLEDVPTPQPGPGQVLVRVLASAANFPDVLMCRGLYQIKPPLPFTPGVELCGEVVAVGEEVTSPAVGDRVLGPPVLPHGGFAEYAVMNADGAFPAPASLDDAQAASLHIGYQTGWFGLHRRAALRAGETLLVHAAAGGVGSAAIQLGKAAGARVIGVVGGPDRRSMRSASERTSSSTGTRRTSSRSSRPRPAAGAPTSSTTPSAGRPTSARRSASHSRGGSSSSGSPAVRSSRRRSTTRS